MQFEVIISLISAITAVISAAAAFMTYRATLKLLTHDHDSRRRSEALQLLSRWDEQTLEARKMIMCRWERKFNDNSVIPWAEIQQFYENELKLERESGSADPRKRFITDQMAVVMNYFELLGTAIKHSIAEEKILKEQFVCTFDRWYTILADYRENVIKTRGGKDPWGGSLEHLHGRWRVEKMQPLPPTGK